MATTVELQNLPPAVNVDPNRERLLREAERELPLQYQAGWSDPEKYFYKSGKGLSRQVVEMISKMKGEPDWMAERRLKAYEHFLERPLPAWGADLAQVDFDDIYYYIKPTEGQGRTWSEDSLHSAVVELIAMKGSTLRYTTVQNWANNVYNLVTKRALAYENATVAWIDGNLGSKVTMKYPSVYLMGKGAKAEIVSAAFANSGQVQDAGGKVWHCAPETTSTITSKSVTKGTGRAEFRGWLKIYKGCKNSVSAMR